VVSDRLDIESPIGDAAVVAWGDRPSVEAFPLVVLDLYFGDPTVDGYARIGTARPRFYELGAEVARCLKAGGVVVACMGPVANTPKKLDGPGHRNNAWGAKAKRSRSEHLPHPEYESSYDWLDQGLLSELKLGHQYVKASTGIQWNLPRDRFCRVREAFKRFFAAFSGVHVYRGGSTHISYRIEEQLRWDTIQSIGSVHPQILGAAEHTALPVAISFNYNHFGGQLVLMPLFEAPADAFAARLLVLDIKDLGEWVHSTARQQPEEPPAWASGHLAPPAVAIQEEISKLEARSAELTPQIEPYRQMLQLLCGTGTDLEDALERLFDSPSEQITVTRTEPGAFLDMFVQDPSGRTLAIEATGVKGRLQHSDRHWADFLQHTPEHNARNQSGRVERMVLVVNTFRESPPAERDRDGDITDPVIKTTTDNGICVARSADLYQLWLKTFDSMTVQDVFDTLFDTEGVYDPSNSPG